MVAPILLDMDGVVLQGGSTDDVVYERAVGRILAEFGVEASATRRARLSRHQFEPVEAACDELGIETARFWERREELASEIANRRIRAGKRGVYPDVDSLGAVAEATTLALVSNNRHATVECVAEHVDVPFAAARGRDPTVEGVGRKKPEPDYIEETMDELGIGAGIDVGDRRKDMIAAERAGLEGAFLRREHNREEPLPAEAAHELASLAELEELLE